MFLKDKKGTSLVELIAVIVIMGIIAGIAIPTTIAVINRQKRNATLNALNDIYNSTHNLLILVETGDYDPNITLVDHDFCYISLTTLIDSGNVDRDSFKPEGNEVYFCYNMYESWAVITNGNISKEKPNTTGVAHVYNVNITWNYESKEFVAA